jgi:hypothetical protein
MTVVRDHHFYRERHVVMRPGIRWYVMEVHMTGFGTMVREVR